MKYTAEQVYDKLINEDKILSVQGQIRFFLGNVDIIVKQRDVVGNIIQEWLEGWLKANGIDYAPNENSQMPPDIYLDPNDRTKNLLEVKAFNYRSSPGFDIADFNAYQREIIREPWMLHTKYIIFGYDMTEEGYVYIKDLWLKNVWEICRPMQQWPLNLQVKHGIVQKIRPATWYSSKGKFSPFKNLEDFLSAVEECVFRNPDTRPMSAGWQNRMLESYESFYGKKLKLKRWYEIEEDYINS